DSFAAGIDISGPYPGNETTPGYSYANALYELLKENHPNLELKKFARSGEISDGLIANQLTNATSFMKAFKGLIIPSLKEAGGEGVQYAATTYFDSFSFYAMLDDSLVSLYINNGFKVADLRYVITNNTICNYTYWCDYKNWHPNSNGGRAIANVLFSNLSSIS
ncbi:26051_t:CDS:2, partial [Racocetra persica]